MKNRNLTPAIIAALILSFGLFATTDVNAQSCKEKQKTACAKHNPQTLKAINAEIMMLEIELANIESVAKQNNIDLGTPYSYSMIDNKNAVAVVEDKSVAKK